MTQEIRQIIDNARSTASEPPRDFFVDRLADCVAERLTKMHGRRKRVYDLDEAAVYLSLSDDAVRDMVAQRKLTPMRPTRKLQFDVYELDRYVSEETQKNRL